MNAPVVPVVSNSQYRQKVWNDTPLLYSMIYLW